MEVSVKSSQEWLGTLLCTVFNFLRGRPQATDSKVASDTMIYPSGYTPVETFSLINTKITK